MSIRIIDLKLFIKVVQLGSFTAAANALDVPAANVSRRIKELENAFGVQLFYRTTRKLRLTQQGEEYYNELILALDALDKANNILLSPSDKPAGKVRLGLPPESDIALHSILVRFQQQYPDIELDVRFTYSSHSEIIDKGLDVAMFVGKQPDSRLVARHAKKISRIMVASPEYIERYGYPKDLDDITKHHHCICYRWPDGSLDDIWDLVENKIQVSTRLSSDNFGYIYRSALAGQGIGFLPVLIMRQDLESNKLVQILPQFQSKQDDVWLLYPDRRGVSRAARLLIDFLLEEAKYI